MNHDYTHYERLMASAKAEHILNKSKIHINIPLLKILIKERSNKNNLLEYYYALDGSFVRSEYYSRDKTTSRLFTTPGSLNLITLSDPDVKSCINSRHEDGFIVELDYKQFEPMIMESIIDYNFNGDIHTIISESMGITRDEAKKVNNSFFYGMSPENINKLVDINDYSELMKGFIEARNEFVKPHIESYEINGYVVSPYGRKVFPKNANNIFNNIIQSTGSDILIDVICELHKTNKFDILFHRFDSLFFDMTRSDVYLYLGELRKLMGENKLNINLGTSVYIGKDLHKLKKLKE